MDHHIPPTVKWHGCETLKRLINKATHDGNGPYLALSDYCNTPWSDTLGLPAQHLIDRQAQTLIPTSSTLLKPETINPITVLKITKIVL